MRFTLAQLEAFYWVARLGTFLAAAEHLHLSQPTVSIRIRDLEQVLGAGLFERQGRNVRLTVEGAGLLGQAERMLGLATQIEGWGSRNRGSRVLLRLGATEMFAVACLARLTEWLTHAQPEVKLEVTIANSFALMPLINERQLDLAFIANPDIDRRLRAEPLGHLQMSWVGSSRLDLPATVRPADLMTYQIITNPHPSLMFRIAMDWFRGAGVEPLSVHTCNSPLVIARLTAAGVGVSVLPPSVFEAELAAGTVRMLRARPSIPRTTMFAVYHASEGSAGLKSVIEASKAVIASTRLLLPIKGGRTGERMAL